MILLDTNVLSELMKATPTPGVLAWVAGRVDVDLYTTAITQAEILHGIALLPSGRRRDGLENAALAMFTQDLGGRVLPFDSDAASAYAKVAVTRRRAGRPISHFDAQIAAIALVNRAPLATRNGADFAGLGIQVIDPWKA